MRTPTFLTVISPGASSRAAGPVARGEVATRARDRSTVERSANADVLLWQNKLRALLTVLVAGGAIALSGSPVAIAQATALYLGALALESAYVWRSRAVGNAILALSTARDLTLLFTLVAIAAPPHQFVSALLVSFLVLQFTVFYFGRAAGGVAVAGTMVGYVLLVAYRSSSGAPMVWREEMWMLGLYFIVSVVFVDLHGTLSGRLSRLVDLFARAQEGDFTRGYDADADQRPDGITLVGRAYNQFRMQLADLVLTDSLTGCLNRRGLRQQLRRAVAQLERSGGELTLLAVDVDHFKAINDQHGHLAGDVVLREIGARLRALLRPGDVIARTGGEEFLVMLPGLGAARGQALARSMCGTFRDQRFTALDRGQSVTVSIGMVSDRVTDPGVAEAMLARADEALYAAKRAGRNQVVMWTPGMRAALDANRVSTPRARPALADVSLRRTENGEPGAGSGGRSASGKDSPGGTRRPTPPAAPAISR